MGWLVGYTLASFAAAYIVSRIFDHVCSGMTGGVVNAARAGLFVTAWTAVTAKSGMRGFTDKVRKLRKSNADASDRLDALMKGKR